MTQIVEAFTYIKDDGTASDRFLMAVDKPTTNLFMMDLSEIPTEHHGKFLELYEQYTTEILKPYKKLEATFKKENLKTLDSFLFDNGFNGSVVLKTFKAGGLIPKTKVE